MSSPLLSGKYFLSLSQPNQWIRYRITKSRTQQKTRASTSTIIPATSPATVPGFIGAVGGVAGVETVTGSLQFPPESIPCTDHNDVIFYRVILFEGVFLSCWVRAAAEIKHVHCLFE